MKRFVSSAAEVAALFAIGYGIWQWSKPLAWVYSGAATLAWCAVTELQRRKARSDS